MKYDPLNKTVAFRTGKDIAQLMSSRGKTMAKPANVVSPTTETETVLYAIWKNLLGHSGFGVNDDFFHVGGNSLMAVQLASRISRQFLIQLPLIEIFLQPTIAGLATLIDKKEKGQPAPSIAEVVSRPRHIPL